MQSANTMVANEATVRFTASPKTNQWSAYRGLIL